MAPRKPRRNPQPPNRNRSRSPRVPSVADIRAAEPKSNLSYDRHVLGNESSAPARASAARNITYETALAIQAAKSGDDTELLPYQPTPSINPPRPRTLAAGYDPDTQTLRIRFREGRGYGYYNVPPNVWRNFRRAKSPGRFINRVLNHYEYAEENW